MIKETARQKINSLKSFVEKSGIAASSIVLKEYNFEFDAIQENKKVKVLLYFGKKGLKLILQGDQKSSFFNLVHNIVNEEPTLELNEQKIDEPTAYIGSDEAGKGDIFGPLVVAAVFVEEANRNELYKIGVRDSKDLSDSQIDVLANKIKATCANQFCIIEYKPKLYNELYEKFSNLNKLLSFGHSKAIENLLDNTSAEIVISDKFSKSGIEIQRNPAFSHIEFIETEKAERFIAVAAASILARNTFNNWFYKFESLGLNFPKGSSSKAQSFLKSFVDETEKDELNNFVKLHFKNVKEFLL